MTGGGLLDHTKDTCIDARGGDRPYHEAVAKLGLSEAPKEMNTRVVQGLGLGANMTSVAHGKGTLC